MPMHLASKQIMNNDLEIWTNASKSVVFHPVCKKIEGILANTWHKGTIIGLVVIMKPSDKNGRDVVIKIQEIVKTVKWLILQKPLHTTPFDIDDLIRVWTVSTLMVLAESLCKGK